MTRTQVTSSEYCDQLILHTQQLFCNETIQMLSGHQFRLVHKFVTTIESRKWHIHMPEHLPDIEHCIDICSNRDKM